MSEEIERGRINDRIDKDQINKDQVNKDRRRFLRDAAMTIAAAEFAAIGSLSAQSSKKNPADVPATKPGTNTSFAAIKQIDAGLLNVGYAEAGSGPGRCVAQRRSGGKLGNQAGLLGGPASS